MPIHNVLQALECYDVCHPKRWTAANSQGAGCQARIDLYTNTMLPLQGILVYNTGLEMCTRTYMKLMPHKNRGIKTDLLVKMLCLFLYTKVTS